MTMRELLNRAISLLGYKLVRVATLETLTVASEERVEFCRAREQALLSRFSDVEKRVLEKGNEQIRHQIASQWSIIDACEPRLPTELECALCGHAGPSSEYKIYSSHCIFEGGDLTRFQCPRCDVIFGPLKMLKLTPRQLAQDYRWHYKVFSEGDSTELELRAFQALNPQKEGTYLNYGCGQWSKTNQILRSQGWNVFGFEPHATSGDNQEGLISDVPSLQKIKFDGIFSNNVLEHLRHPAEELIFMKSILKKQGKMSHVTSCYEYMYEFTRFHLYFFLGRSRQLLAQNAGLEILKYEVDGEYMNCIFIMP